MGDEASLDVSVAIGSYSTHSYVMENNLHFRNSGLRVLPDVFRCDLSFSQRSIKGTRHGRTCLFTDKHYRSIYLKVTKLRIARRTIETSGKTGFSSFFYDIYDSTNSLYSIQRRVTSKDNFEQYMFSIGNRYSKCMAFVHLTRPYIESFYCTMN